MPDAQQPLSQEADRLLDLLTVAQDVAGLAAWEFDVPTNHIYWTDHTYRLHETTRDEFSPSVVRVLRFFTPQTGTAIRQSLTAAVEKGISFDMEVAMTTARGRPLWVRLCGVPKIQNGQTLRVAGIIQDVTSRRQKNAWLELLAKSIAHLNDTVLITDVSPIDAPGPIIVFANEAFTRMTGYSSEEVIGKNPRFLQGPKTDRMELNRLRKALKLQKPVRAEFINYHKNGSEFIVEMDIVPVSDHDGRYTHWVSIQRNVTARKQAEAMAALREAQKIESLGTLAGGIAHDFNNILTAILGNVAIARNDTDNTILLEASLDRINQAGSRARGLIQRILSYSRRQPETFAQHSVNSIVVEACELVRSTLPVGVRLEISTPQISPLVMANSGQLLQVLLNLATNAWHAIGDHRGCVKVAVQTVNRPADSGFFVSEQGAATSTSTPDGHDHQEVQIEVSDDGVGMDEATVSRIFEPYFTTKPLGHGTGLGLAVVWGIVAAHQGRITAESQLGNGSVFRVLLPLCKAVESPLVLDLHGAKSSFSAQGQHVLLLDDDDVVGITLQALLERAGYQVSLFQDPLKAIAQVRLTPKAFDVVVTDFNMPALSGAEVISEIRQIRSDLPVLLGSGYLSDDVLAEAHKVGASHVFNKEFAVERLTGLLSKTLLKLSTG